MKTYPFTESDFQIFQIPGLSERMEAIQQQIQPKFKQIGPIMADFLTDSLQQPFYVHIAKHARRTVHPPEQTWLAWSTHHRGYKPYPHFQFGIDAQSLFIWFSIFRECKQKERFSHDLSERLMEWWVQLPADFLFSEDHTKEERIPIGELDTKTIAAKLERLRQIKKAEFLCGLQIPKQTSEKMDWNALLERIKQTFHTLFPLYKITQISEQNSFLA